MPRRTYLIISISCFLILIYCNLTCLSLIFFGKDVRVRGHITSKSKQRTLKGNLHYEFAYAYKTPSGYVIKGSHGKSTKRSVAPSNRFTIRYIPTLPFMNSISGLSGLWIGFIFTGFFSLVAGTAIFQISKKFKDNLDLGKDDRAMLILVVIPSIIALYYEIFGP